ncbi:MAG: M14-type cytosolic carboxypeptidase [Kiritimatiellae bacterium]|nr:M14-type cytosolic carboxypeptidase [Kiritimatiellia bacterium]
MKTKKNRLSANRQKTASNRPPVMLDADFEGGGLENIRKAGDRHFVCSLRKGTSPAPLWYYFRLRGVKNRRVLIEIDNAHDIKNDKSYLDDPEFWPIARPVFSYDKKHYGRIRNPHYDPASGVFSFAHRFKEDTAYVSFSFPYVCSDLEKYLARIRSSPHVRIRRIARSGEKRNIYWIAVTDAAIRTVKKGVWILARQHAGETPGSFAVEGLVNYLLSDASAARRLRKEFEFNLAPMVDADNVARGHYGKDSQPVDYNRDWKSVSRRPVVRAIKTAIDRWAKTRRISVFMDFHAPGLRHGNDMGEMPARLARGDLHQYNRFSALLAAQAPKCSPYQRRHFQEHETLAQPGHAISWFYRRYGAFSTVLEISYHRTVRGKNRYATPASLRAYGAAIAKTVYYFSNPEKKFKEPNI